ncbi:MAG: hypothetical protein MUF38_08970 [Anaerolineae bacterium]|nr:hypothetical protein [Anaerolineae bacterium]
MTKLQYRLSVADLPRCVGRLSVVTDTAYHVVDVAEDAVCGVKCLAIHLATFAKRLFEIIAL